MDSYKIATYFNRQNHIHGGALIYVKNDIETKQLNDIKELSEEMHIECCAISFNVNDNKYCIINIYRPPNGNINTFIYRLTLILNNCFSCFKNVIICGDMNIDHLNLKKNPEKEKEKNLFIDLLNSYELSFKNNEPTTVFSGINNIVSISQIDYFATNISQELYNESTEPFNIGDHLGILFTLQTQNVKCLDTQAKKIITKRDTSENNLWQLKNYLQLEHFNSVYECTIDINYVYNEFLKALLYAIDLTCPLIKISTENKKIARWITWDVKGKGRELKDVLVGEKFIG